MVLHIKISPMKAVFNLLEISPHAYTQNLHDWQAHSTLLKLNCATVGGLFGLKKNTLRLMGTFPLIPVGSNSNWLSISSKKQGIYTPPTFLIKQMKINSLLSIEFSRHSRFSTKLFYERLAHLYSQQLFLAITRTF